MSIFFTHREQEFVDSLKIRAEELFKRNLSREDFHREIVDAMNQLRFCSDTALNHLMKGYDNESKKALDKQIARILSTKNHKGKISARKYTIAQWRRKF